MFWGVITAAVLGHFFVHTFCLPLVSHTRCCYTRVAPQFVEVEISGTLGLLCTTAPNFHALLAAQVPTSRPGEVH
jgi:hypothetical protein